MTTATTSMEKVINAINETRPRTVSYAVLTASDHEIADEQARDEFLDAVHERLRFDEGLSAEVEALP